MATVESTEPPRPPGVPASGVWNEAIGKWETVATDGLGGAREGECLRYRADGTLYSRSHFVAGLEDGPFTVYHPNGSLAREGRYAAGRVEGVLSIHAPPDGHGEPLRACCVPPGATRLDLTFRSGELLLEVFSDGDGRPLLSDGQPRPPVPDGLPELVSFDEHRGAWVMRRDAFEKFWAADGRPLDEEQILPDGRRVTRIFDADGTVMEERGRDAQQRRAGPFFRRLAADAPGVYADPRIRQERGTFEDGQAVGTWTFLDAEGGVVRTIDRGVAVTAAVVQTSPAFAPVLSDGWATARGLVARGCVREGLCAAARAAARSGDAEALRAFLAGHVVPLAPPAEAEQGEALVHAGDIDVVGALDALVGGADAPSVFRTLGAVIPGATPAVVDLVEAALLLAPGRSSIHITRALVRAQAGDRAGALADARAVEAEVAGASASLVQYIDFVFRPFTLPEWWSQLDRDAAVTDAAGAEDAAAAVAGGGEGGAGDDDGEDAADPPIGQSLEAIQHMVNVYATRLGRLRAAIRQAGAGGGAGDVATEEPVWWPPDVSSLLPDGPVALMHETVTCDPDPETGAVETIDIDEELAIEGATVPGLLSLAHADHAALAWLCWATGLGAIAMPRAIEPPATLVAGMQTIVQRHWRADDRVKSGGLVALGRGVPGFEWLGVAIDDMPDHMVSGVLGELLAVRSMFLWLLSPDTVSPFQDDIRSA